MLRVLKGLVVPLETWELREQLDLVVNRVIKAQGDQVALLGLPAQREREV